MTLELFTLLFASQDATSSACSWLIQIMADRPTTLKKVREEGETIMGDRYIRNGVVSLSDLDKMA